MRNKSMIPIIITVVILGGFLLIWTREDRKESSELLENIYHYSGYTRVISKEEFDFYQYFVERDLPAETSRQEIEEKTIAYAERINAIFFIGNKLELCEPYSFELLKLRMEQENETRKLKQGQGEIIYGLEQFTLETYFQYMLGNLETALHQYLELNADEGIQKSAKVYYRNNKNLFQYRENVIYEMTFAGETQLLSADAAQMSSLGKSDPGLADFLYTAEAGDRYEDIQDDKIRKVILKEIGYNEGGFEENQEIILYKYIRDKLYEEMIQKIIINNPTEFENF